jgi:hypothetical protein
MRHIAERVVNQMRPAPTYGTVVSVDRDARRCMVRFSADSDPVGVAMGSIQPSRPGQVVRVEGTLGDRYVDDVLGESVVSGGLPLGMLFEYAGATPPSWAMVADGRSLPTDGYVALFGEIGYRYGGAGTQFSIPTRTSSDPRIAWLIRVM